jgi:hypothetical protein
MFMDTGSTTYTPSDRLAIALASGSVAVLIALYIVEKTPLTVGILVVLLVAFSTYPVVHFFRRTVVRILMLLLILLVGVAIGWSGLRLKNTPTAQASSQPLAQDTTTPATAPQPTQKPAKKTQSLKVKGDNNNSANVDQSGGNNNNAVIGNNNNVGNTYHNAGESGWLVPANDPTPPNSCATRIIDQGGYIVFLGTLAAGSTRMPNIVMSAGGQPRIVLATNEHGELAITTDIFDSKDDIVVSLEKNNTSSQTMRSKSKIPTPAL